MNHISNKGPILKLYIANNENYMQGQEIEIHSQGNEKNFQSVMLIPE